jgi:hypothetical protein
MPTTGDTLSLRVTATNLGADDINNVALQIAFTGLQFIGVDDISAGSYDSAAHLWTLPNVFEYESDDDNYEYLVLTFTVIADSVEPEITFSATEVSSLVPVAEYETLIDEALPVSLEEMADTLAQIDVTRVSKLVSPNGLLDPLVQAQNNGTVFVDGSMGVDTAMPQKLLQVGAGTDAPVQTYEGIYVSIPGNAQIAVRNNNANVDGGMFAHDNGNFYLGAWTNSPLILRTNNADRVAITTAGKVGFGTTVVPHGGIGAALLALEGSDASSASGPNIQFTTALDDYPLLQVLPYTHDNINLVFDAYFDAGGWKSSDAGSNAALAKVVDTFRLRRSAGNAQGAGVTWTDALSLNLTNGNVRVVTAADVGVARSVNSEQMGLYVNDVGGASHVHIFDSGFGRTGAILFGGYPYDKTVAGDPSLTGYTRHYYTETARRPGLLKYRMDEVTGWVFYVGNTGVTTADTNITWKQLLNLQHSLATLDTPLRIRGADSANEIADLWVGPTGELVISTVAGNDAGRLIDLRPADDNYGIIIRDSSGAGTGPYLNVYVTDDTLDYAHLVVRNVQSAAQGLYIQEGGSVGVMGVPDHIFHVVSGAANVGAHLGNAYVGNWSSTSFAQHSHWNYRGNAGGYGFIQNSAGAVYLSAPTGSAIFLRINNSTTMQIGSSAAYITGSLFLNSTANSFMTQGITINQGSSTNEILAFQNSSLAHGITALADTKTYTSFGPYSGSTGGVRMRSFSTQKVATYIEGIVTNEDTLHSSSSVGAIMITGSKKSGTGKTYMAGNTNLLVITNNDLARYIFDSSGNFYADIGSGTFDNEDDVALIRALELARGDKTLIRSEFDKWIKYNRADLERLNLAQFDKKGSVFVNYTGLSMLHSGAIWQMHQKMMTLQNKIEAIERMMN